MVLSYEKNYHKWCQQNQESHVGSCTVSLLQSRLINRSIFLDQLWSYSIFWTHKLLVTLESRVSYSPFLGRINLRQLWFLIVDTLWTTSKDTFTSWKVRRSLPIATRRSKPLIIRALKRLIAAFLLGFFLMWLRKRYFKIKKQCVRRRRHL